MMKRKKREGMALLLLTALCLSTEGMSAMASPEFARSQEEWASLSDNRLEWEEIPGLVNEYNATVLNNRKAYQKDSGQNAEEIRDALKIADQRGLHYEFIPTDIPGAHPNTARMHVTGDQGGSCVVEGASIGGGNIRVDYINGMRVDFTGERNTILVMHYDKPGLIAAVTNLMAEKYRDVNIGNFRLSRPVKGGEAVMTIEIDGMPPKGMIEDIKGIRDVTNAILIRAI